MINSQVAESGDKYILDTYGRFSPVPFKGKGVHMVDCNGKKYLDFGSGIGVNALGYCDDDWAEAIARQAKILSHTSNLFYNMPSVSLAKKLTEISGLNKVFFCNSGAEANEGAIKTARKYSFDKYGEGRDIIISLKNSFHGRTITTLEATGQDTFHQYFFPFTGGFKYVEANNIEAFDKAADGQVCAVMMEGVQGEGGVIPLDKEFVKAVEKIAKERDILVVFDEVQTGIGRTGLPFSYMDFDLLPDIVTLAKGLGGGLPIGAFLCGEKCEHVLGKSQHGSTFGANPIVCAGADVVLRKVMNEEFLNEVTKKGEYIKKTIQGWKSPYVSDVRGKGLMIGIALFGADVKDVCARLCEKGLLALTAGQNTLRFLPPLVITKKEIDEGLVIVKELLDELSDTEEKK